MPYLSVRPATDARPRLFCFPHAGGSASVFTVLRNVLADRVNVVPVQLPGRERRLRDPLPMDMAALVADLDTQLDPYLDRPYALYGHSMGALVAHDLAVRRAQRGASTPRRLLTGACRALHLPAAFAAAHAQPDRVLREQMLSCGGLSEDMLAYPDWVEAALTLTRGDLRLCASRVHTPAGPMPWPVEAFHGAGDPLVAEREAAAWAEHSNGEFGLHRLPGGSLLPGRRGEPAVRGPRRSSRVAARRTGGEQSMSALEIAVVGLACRLPGAPDPQSFWRVLRDGVDAVTEAPPGRWDSDLLPHRFGGFLDEVDGFDAEFFGVSPREAVTMDPQGAPSCPGFAGIVPGSLRGSRAGVFAGAIWDDYAALMSRHGIEAIDRHTLTGSQRSIIANRVSYLLGLRGPSLAVDTGQSSSLAAVHMACESLIRGESTGASRRNPSSFTRGRSQRPHKTPPGCSRRMCVERASAEVRQGRPLQRYTGRRGVHDQSRGSPSAGQ
ncbi:alpha/beta fold hydrolase [Streptomyces sp. NBC_01373]|uniref:alpha/beta fold hydrolase n=1 Tax=Streptomyces sp. NBC_01373 TaxID=2903843 RepID=UPI00224E384B|nr:alpha/beta fold hydrolase [Streptomyces sp. NBC_01373]MCX4704048.1 alpha/beta fold hydrolase [Streptomyces sp. NBC_01373]